MKSLDLSVELVRICGLLKSTLWFGFDCKWLHTSELRLSGAHPGVLLNSSEFDQCRKNRNYSLTGILRCFLMLPGRSFKDLQPQFLTINIISLHSAIET